MKYNIYINQRSIVENWFNLDLTDCAIMDYVKDFPAISKVRRINIWGVEYFWIHYETFIKEMPLLKISSKRSLSRRLDKLVEEKILEKYVNNNNTTYFKLWVNYEAIIHNNVDRVVKEEGGLKSTTPLDSKVQPPVLKSTTIYNNTINTHTNNKEHNTCALAQTISDFETEVPLENSTLGGKEKNSEKKEKLDKLTNYGIGEKIILDEAEPKTNIDKCRVILYIHNYLKKDTWWLIRWEDTFFAKLDKQFKKWIDYKDIISAIWTLHHNKFCNWEAWWRKWKWDFAYLFDSRWIDKAWKFAIDKIDSETSTELRLKLKNVLTLPEEFWSAKNAKNWVSYNYEWMNPIDVFDNTN